MAGLVQRYCEWYFKRKFANIKADIDRECEELERIAADPKLLATEQANLGAFLDPLLPLPGTVPEIMPDAGKPTDVDIPKEWRWLLFGGIFFASIGFAVPVREAWELPIQWGFRALGLGLVLIAAALRRKLRRTKRLDKLLTRRIRLRTSLQDHAGRKSDCAELIKMSPYSEWAWYNYAMAKLNLAEYDGALRLGKQFIRRDPDSPYNYLLALFAITAGDNEKKDILADRLGEKQESMKIGDENKPAGRDLLAEVLRKSPEFADLLAEYDKAG